MLILFSCNGWNSPGTLRGWWPTKSTGLARQVSMVVICQSSFQLTSIVDVLKPKGHCEWELGSLRCWWFGFRWCRIYKRSMPPPKKVKSLTAGNWHFLGAPTFHLRICMWSKGTPLDEQKSGEEVLFRHLLDVREKKGNKFSKSSWKTADQCKE